jgi:hypothetical protein
MIRQEEGVMSDQADNLRQLVRARREWREAADPLDTPRSVPGPSLAAEGQVRREIRPKPPRKGGGLLLALAARWALARANR